MRFLVVASVSLDWHLVNRKPNARSIVRQDFCVPAARGPTTASVRQIAGTRVASGIRLEHNLIRAARFDRRRCPVVRFRGDRAALRRGQFRCLAVSYRLAGSVTLYEKVEICHCTTNLDFIRNDMKISVYAVFVGLELSGRRRAAIG